MITQCCNNAKSCMKRCNSFFPKTLGCSLITHQMVCKNNAPIFFAVKSQGNVKLTFVVVSKCTYLGKPKRWQIQAILMIPTNHFENWKKAGKNALKLDVLKKCKIVHIICIGFMYKMEWHGHLVHQNPVRRSFGYQTCRHSQHPFF